MFSLFHKPSLDLLGNSCPSLLGNQLLAVGPEPHPPGHASAPCQGPAGRLVQVSREHLSL